MPALPCHHGAWRPLLVRIAADSSDRTNFGGPRLGRRGEERLRLSRALLLCASFTRSIYWLKMKACPSGIHTAVLIGFVLSPQWLVAEDWPQWRGPSSQGISAETGLPVHWSAKENVAWKATLVGFGASSPI